MAVVHCLAHKLVSVFLALQTCLVYIQKDEPDAFKELGTGNRIATWLFYVSNSPHLTQYLCLVKSLFMFGFIS